MHWMPGILEREPNSYSKVKCSLYILENAKY